MAQITPVQISMNFDIASEVKAGSASTVLSALAKEGKALQEAADEAAKKEEEVTKEKTKKEAVVVKTVKLALADYPDFILERDYAHKVVQFVYLVSAGTCFLKTINKKSGESTTELYTDPVQYTRLFDRASDKVEFSEGFWIGKIDGSMDSARWLLSVIRSEDDRNVIVHKAAKCNYAEFGFEPSRQPSGKIYIAFPKLFDLIMKLVNEAGSDQNLVRCFDYNCGRAFIGWLLSEYGLDNTRDYISCVFQTPLITTGNFGFPNVYSCSYRMGQTVEELREFCRINADYKRFKEYTLYQSVQMGYGWKWDDFFTEWDDTLRMQTYVYGKVTDKYPTCLPMTHRQLSTMTQIRKIDIDEMKLAKAFETCKVFEGFVWDTDLKVVAPASRQDILNEATRQSNCLASYMNNIIDGRSIILFVRKKDDIEASHITMELDPVNYTIVQCKYAFNREVPVDIQRKIAEHIRKRLAKGDEQQQAVC